MGNATSENVTGLTAGITYYYRVRGYDACGAGANSGTITYPTLSTPLAPVADNGSNQACSQITANWETTVGATGYYLDVATDVGFTSFVSGYQNLDAGNSITTNVSA